jgi:hypothetical protein
MVSPLTLGWGPAGFEIVAASAPSSTTFEAAAAAAYFPILVQTTCMVRRLWWANGATVDAGYNIDVGIYADSAAQPGVLLLGTGNTAQGTALQVQFAEVTDTTLTPGRYWLAIACSSASATFMVSTLPVGATNAVTRFEQSSASPLPASATPVETAQLKVYLFGFATTASP